MMIIAMIWLSLITRVITYLNNINDTINITNVHYIVLYYMPETPDSCTGYTII